jgi:hypothetical protein
MTRKGCVATIRGSKSALIHIYTYGDYSIINNRIILYTYSVLLTRQVCSALYDYTVLLVREI